MRIAAIVAAAGLVILPAVSGVALADGTSVGRDCHVVRVCNFSRTASVRGCLSAFACRQCRYVKVPVVSFDGIRRLEYRSVCAFGNGEG